MPDASSRRSRSEHLGVLLWPDTHARSCCLLLLNFKKILVLLLLFRAIITQEGVHIYDLSLDVLERLFGVLVCVQLVYLSELVIKLSIDDLRILLLELESILE